MKKTNSYGFLEIYIKGELSSKRSFKEGYLDGPTELFDETGELSAIINFERDLVQGVSRFWNKGQCVREANYKDGLLEGLTEDFTADGILIQRATYLRGQLDGAIVRFWLNGNIMEETDYSEGEIIGETRLYDERGKRISDKKEKNMVGTLTKVFRGE